MALSLWCWLCRHAERLQDKEGFHPDFKEALGGQAECGGVRIPAVASEHLIHEADREKPKQQWRLQGVGEATVCQRKP
jgi:hypothetical protein